MKNIYKTKINTLIPLLTVIALAIVVSIPMSASASNGYYLNSGGTSTGSGYNAGSNYNNYYNGNNYTNYNNTNYIAPIIYSVTPNSMSYGSTSAKVIDITGANFTQGLIARFNGNDRPTTFNNSSDVTMVVYPSDMTTAGSYLVTVYNQYNGYVSNAAYINLSANGATVGTAAGAGTLVGDYPPTNTGTTAKKSTTKKTTVTTKDNNLTANALGSGFMPATFIQWILLLILILLFVFLWRKLFIAPRDKNAPLKHA